ncbi:hypothetical protein [Stenotrophomonas sp. 24(2023)]|uniref:hypothetical protein n=1 Tax=Stenotrophomonas sp. 24(2023) TaxID=3068324 RepID=UPI0027E0F20E|nr:hypothetical protein [Stenotrophomonas sp. 24(2023)]WMJ68813.1 hypothetical protein Q9R17_16750 [Stenotrophomonas sp. 24(2023)]
MYSLIRFVQMFWRLVIGGAADGLAWLGRPGSKLRLACVVLALGCLASSLVAHGRKQRIRDLGAQVAKIKVDWDADARRLQADVRERDQRLAAIAAALQAEATKREALKAESAAALKALAGRLQASRQATASWEARYGQRPESCKAALALLDSACPALKGY